MQQYLCRISRRRAFVGSNRLFPYERGSDIICSRCIIIPTSVSPSWICQRRSLSNHHSHGRMMEYKRSSSVVWPSTMLCQGRKWSSQASKSPIFVSKHNQSLQLTGPQIKDWCQSHGLTNTRTTNSHVILRECPFCVKPTNDQADNLYKLYIQIGGGAYFCHRCGAKGSWFDFKSQVSPNHQSTIASFSNTNTTTTTNNNNNNNNLSPKKLPMPARGLAAVLSSNLLDLSSEDNDALGYLTSVRGLKKETLRKYCVGRAFYSFPTSGGRYVKTECVTFPWNIRANEIANESVNESANESVNESAEEDTPDGSKFINSRIKARALSNKSWQRLDPPGGGWGFFGWHTIPADATEIIITEGEYDAMAVYQATGRPAISLPNGCRSLPLQVLPLLERFTTIYLWMDNDGPGREGAEQFAKKIGIDRCLVVQQQEAKDANEALLLHLDLQQMLQEATILPHEQIMSFQELRDQVFQQIVDPDKYAGVPSTSLPTLTKLIKGFRRGEMTVLTGPTGSGKTTFLGQLSIDLAEQGVNTLWGSFEIKNTRLIHKLLQQYSKQPLPDFAGGSQITPTNNDQDDQKLNRDKLNVLMDRFGTLPLQFMKFHGGSDIDDVLDAMEYAAYAHDSQHFILDNMQFMISRDSTTSRNYDKFDVQDAAVEKFRKFATEQNVHVTLVVHPRKEEEFQKLSISSIYGSAKATQEADTVLILQNDGRRKFIDVKKNRFDGTTGTVPLHFHRPSNTYTEQPIFDRDNSIPNNNNNRDENHTYNNTHNNNYKNTKIKSVKNKTPSQKVTIPTTKFTVGSKVMETNSPKTNTNNTNLEHNIMAAYFSDEGKDDEIF